MAAKLCTALCVNYCGANAIHGRLCASLEMRFGFGTHGWQSQVNSALLLQVNATTGTLLIVSESTGEYQFGRTVPILTGAKLGGSSSINGSQWTISQPGDVESWGISG